MTSQDELFHEDWRDSMKHLVKALGGQQVVGIEVWPSKTREAAGSWLSDCLSRTRDAKLDLEEILLILKMGRERGLHCGNYTLQDSIGYERPSEAALKSPKTLLLEKQAQLAADVAKIQRDIDRIDAASALKAVK